MEADFLVRHFSGDRVVLPPVEDLVDDLRDRFLRCQVCTQLYVTEQRGAKVLACGHGLCSLCLQRASTPEGVRCQQCSPVRVVFGQPVSDWIRETLMDLIAKSTPDLGLGEQEYQSNPDVPDAATFFLTTLKEQLLTCAICEHAFDCENHKLVTLSCQHELCSRCEKKMAERKKKECPFCRKEFHRPSGSSEDTLPAQLLKWLQPFLPALPSMTSNSADAFLDRLSDLQEILETREREMMRRNNPEDLLESLRSFLLGPDTSGPGLSSESLEGGARPDEEDLTCTQFATACRDVLKECVTAESSSSQQVCSVLNSVLRKMEEHARNSRHVRQAMVRVGALQPLVQTCWKMKFLDKLSSETKKQLTQSTWRIGIHILLQDEVNQHPQTFESTLKMLVDKVEAAGIEDGMTLMATQLLVWITVYTQARGEIVDIVIQSHLPARFVRICRDAQAAEFGRSAIRKETIQEVCFGVGVFTHFSEAFSTALLDAGMVPLLLDACTHLGNASSQDEEKVSDAMLSIIISISRFPNLLHSLDGVFGMLVDKVAADGIENGVTLKAAMLLAEINSYQKNKQKFADNLAQFNLPARLVRICLDAQSSESARRDVRKATLKLIYGVVQNFTYHSEAFAAAVIDAGMLPLLIEACGHLENAPTEDEEDLSGTALNIIDNISRFPSLQHHLVDKGVIGLLIPSMQHDNKGFAILVIFVLAQLCTSEDHVKCFLELFHKDDVLARMKSWTESALDHSSRHFECPDCSSYFCPSDFLTCLFQVTRFPGLPTKIEESGWLGLLSRLLDEGEEEEKRLVLDCLLTLAQCPDVGGRLAENEALVARVRAVQREDCQASSLLLSRLQLLNMAASPP